MAPSADIVIIGGGVIGLSVAWHLARAGDASIVVLERGQVGGGASGAAAGMLAPLAEARAPGPFVTLGLESLHRYPAFAEALRAETELDIELVGPGMLRVAATEEEADALCAAFSWQRAAGLAVERLSGDEARQREPALSPTVRAAVLSPDERHVEPRRLVRALALACARRSVRIEENAPVVELMTEGPRVTGVRTASDVWPCGHVVVAGGAWSEPMGRWLGVSLPVFPVGGQILALRGLPPPLRHTVYGHAGYLVPKADGRIVVGATEERGAGFNVRPTAGGMARLLGMAQTLVPALADAAFDSVWSGLRPGSRDGLPILGPLPGWENAHVATGHFRNGILLAPITGEIVARGIVGLPPLPPSPIRFAGRGEPVESSPPGGRDVWQSFSPNRLPPPPFTSRGGGKGG
jgi:glycine oxidase